MGGRVIYEVVKELLKHTLSLVAWLQVASPEAVPRPNFQAPEEEIKVDGDSVKLSG